MNSGDYKNTQKQNTLSPVKVANQVQSNIKETKTNNLQRDYKELKVAGVINEEKLSKCPPQEKEKNDLPPK